MNLKYTIIRYEKVSDGFLVAFNVDCPELNDSAYVESLLSLNDINEKTQMEICQLAFDRIKPKIDKVKRKFELSKTNILGREFFPDENI